MKERHRRVGTCDSGTYKLDAFVWDTIEIQMVN